MLAFRSIVSVVHVKFLGFTFSWARSSMVEQFPLKELVGGSNPLELTMYTANLARATNRVRQNMTNYSS